MVEDEAGQATVEFVALLPLMAALLAGLWQVALVGYAEWAASAAARAAARAHAVGSDPAAAARAHLARSLERGLSVHAVDDGAVRVAVRIPTLPGVPRLGHARATGHFEPQS
jgi:Flp pilus assembly protein TadG